MTKETYFEMCRQLGSEPIDSEIPLEMDDFPLEVQNAISLYYSLKDDWDSMSGTYLGKSRFGILDMFTVHNIEKEMHKHTLDWVSVMDAARSKAIEAKKSKNKSP
jgi:hypothetical protein